MRGYVLDLERWVRDALAEELPSQILCREDCRGLCVVCGANLNEVGDSTRTEGDAAAATQAPAIWTQRRGNGKVDRPRILKREPMPVPKRKTSNSKRDSRRASKS